MKDKVLVDKNLLIEALSGLNAFGKEATAETQAKLQKAIETAPLAEDLIKTLRYVHGSAVNIREARELAYQALSKLSG